MITEDKPEASTPEEEKETKEAEPAEETELEEMLKEEPAEEKAETEQPLEPAEIEEAEEEEAKPEEKKKKEKEEEIVEERIYTIPLGKASIRPPKKRAPRAIQMIRAFITKHMKLEMHVEEQEEKEELPKLTISKDVNEKVWERGMEKPPRKIRVRAAKDKDGNVTVYLAEGE
jgi:large subunit ribosomal protein L31e